METFLKDMRSQIESISLLNDISRYNLSIPGLFIYVLSAGESTEVALLRAKMKEENNESLVDVFGNRYLQYLENVTYPL